MIGEAMDGTEDFSFPRITGTNPLTIDSPPLWNIPTPATTDQDAGNKAKVIGDDDKCEKDEDTMDLLWENFNEDLYSTSATSSSTEDLMTGYVADQIVEVRCGSGASLTVVKNNGSVIASNSCKPGTLVLLKLLKKVFSLTSPHRKQRLTHTGGDMFKSVPQGEAIMIKGTTHNWSDEMCVQLFSNCREALKEGGKVIIIDLMMPEDPKISNCVKYLSIFDSVMLLQGGGRERTEKEFGILCKRASFSDFKLVYRALSNILGVMEFYK